MDGPGTVASRAASAQQIDARGVPRRIRDHLNVHDGIDARDAPYRPVDPPHQSMNIG